MWYFSWVLGLGLAVLFGVLNAMWLEMHLERKAQHEAKAASHSPGSNQHTNHT